MLGHREREASSGSRGQRLNFFLSRFLWPCPRDGASTVLSLDFHVLILSSAEVPLISL